MQSMTCLIQDVSLEIGELAADTIIAGNPTVRSKTLWQSSDGRVESGIWEISAGTVRDIEKDESFLVLAGRAVVELGDGRTLDLFPGVVGVLRAGEHTVWRVTEPLRKLYQIDHGA